MLLAGIKNAPAQSGGGVSFCIGVLHKVYNRVYKSMRRHTQGEKKRDRKELIRKGKTKTPCYARGFVLAEAVGFEPQAKM